MTLEIEPRQGIEDQHAGSTMASFRFFDIPPILRKDERGLSPHWAALYFATATEGCIASNNLVYFPCSKRPFNEGELVKISQWEASTPAGMSLSQALQPIPEDVEFIEVEKKRVREKPPVHWIPIFNTGISIPLLRIFSIKWKFVGYKQV